METKHTSGPWTAVQGQGAHHRDVYIRAGERKPDGEWPAVARCCSSRVGSFATVKANGQLIAASPELLDACELLTESLSLALDLIPGGEIGLIHALSIGRAAIAKATKA